jgi:hypothetical protein
MANTHDSSIRFLDTIVSPKPSFRSALLALDFECPAWRGLRQCALSNWWGDFERGGIEGAVGRETED